MLPSGALMAEPSVKAVIMVGDDLMGGEGEERREGRRMRVREGQEKL